MRYLLFRVEVVAKSLHAFSTQLWDDFGGQVFHLFSVVEEQVELNEFGSRIRDLAQTCNAGRRRAVDGDTGQARSSVDPPERLINTLICSGCIVVDGNVYAFGDLKVGGILF